MNIKRRNHRIYMLLAHVSIKLKGEGWLVRTAWSEQFRWLAEINNANDNRSHFDLQQVNENDSHLLCIKDCLECLSTPSIRRSKHREARNYSKKLKPSAPP